MALRAASLLAALLLLSPALARADEAEARRLFAEAQARWADPTPDEALRLADAALEARPDTAALELEVHHWIACVHQAKTGDFAAALAELDLVIQALVGVEDPGLRQLKADAMVRKGTISYAETGDAAATLVLYRAAHAAYQLSTTADSASQLAFRMGRDPNRSASDRAAFMDVALLLAREAVALAPREFPQDERRRAANQDKCRLQLVLVLTALGQREEARALWAAIDARRLGEAGLYQLGVQRVLEGDLEGAIELLHRSLRLPVRATPRARNAFRRFVRGEPDLAPLRDRPDCRELVIDERDDAARPGRQASPPRPLRQPVPRSAPTSAAVTTPAVAPLPIAPPSPTTGAAATSSATTTTTSDPASTSPERRPGPSASKRVRGAGLLFILFLVFLARRKRPTPDATPSPAT